MTEQEKDIRERWFKDHKAIYEKMESPHYPLERISWRNGSSSTFYVEYVKSNAGLYVAGDIGDTIIKQNYNFHWFAYSTSTHYIREKIMACSERQGRHLGCDWDENEAERGITMAFRSWNEIFIDRHGEKKKADRRSILEEASRLKSNLMAHRYSHGEFQGYLWESHNEFSDEDIFGSDWYEYIDDGLGLVYSNRVLGQQIGLQMALEQLGMGKEEAAKNK